MKVKELKEQLQKLDDSADIVLKCDAPGDNYCLNIRERFDYRIELENTDFLDDEEKMADFKIQTKEEFLRSYSYLTEQEYDNTNAALADVAMKALDILKKEL